MTNHESTLEMRENARREAEETLLKRRARIKDRNQLARHIARLNREQGKAQKKECRNRKKLSRRLKTRIAKM